MFAVSDAVEVINKGRHAEDVGQVIDLRGDYIICIMPDWPTPVFFRAHDLIKV